MINFLVELRIKSLKDDIFTGAAALTFYLLLSIFPAVIFLFSLLPYLPFDNLEKTILDFASLVWPKEATILFSNVINDVMAHQDARIVSLSLLGTIWTASTGMYAIMRQLNKTFEVTEERPFFKGMTVAILLTIVFGIQVLSVFSLIIFGGILQDFFINSFSYQKLFFIVAFESLRLIISVFSLLLGFALIYHYGPNLKRRFSLFGLGNIIAVVLLVFGSLGFRYYIENFSNYANTYGSLGAVIILMLWLYMAGAILLFGSEVNILAEKHKLFIKKSDMNH